MAGGITTLTPWKGQLLEEKTDLVSFVGVYVLAAVMLAGLS